MSLHVGIYNIFVWAGLGRRFFNRMLVIKKMFENLGTVRAGTRYISAFVLVSYYTIHIPNSVFSVKWAEYCNLFFYICTSRHPINYHTK